MEAGGGGADRSQQEGLVTSRVRNWLGGEDTVDLCPVFKNKDSLA